MNLCNFVYKSDGLYRCTNCQRLVRHSDGNIHAECLASPDSPVPEEPPEPPRQGVGTELTAILASAGIVHTPGCACGDRALAMDNAGIEWCKTNIAEIVGWLKEEANNRGLPGPEFILTRLVKMAIKRAEKKSAA